MSSVGGGVATDRRSATQINFALPAGSQSHSTIINETEFPSLGARSTPSGGGFSPLPTTSGSSFSANQSPLPYKDQINHRANYATLMRGVEASLNPEFQIQNEDFPALPGASPGDHPAQAPASLMTAANDMPVSSAAAAAAAAASSDPFGVRPAGEPARGIITHPDGTILLSTADGAVLSDDIRHVITYPTEGEVSNIPPTMLADQFGMAGLVTYLRTVDNPSIVSLALGYDLTTLGLNLNLSERHLYTSFGGPWADNPIRPHELDVKVPDDYLTNAQIREKLPPVKLNKLSEDVLFYLFYNCPGEVYQLAAACELYQRDWRFHKSDGNWLTRSQYGGVKEQTGSYEKGQYNVFDPLQWRKIPKELKLEYKELEERPKLPAMFGGGGGAAATSMGTSAPRPAS